MSCPRVEIDLDKVGHNASTLVERAGNVGISVTGVTKAVLGLPPLASVLVSSGVAALGDSRIENIETMRAAGLGGPMVLIRSPMPSQVGRVVDSGAISLGTDCRVMTLLATAAQDRGVEHGVVLMVELGDLREGIMPQALESTVAHVLSLRGLRLRGIGANLACRSGIAPDATNMSELSACADRVERQFGLELDIVTGGNSANLLWALGTGDRGRVNNLRLGESILLGCEPLQRQPIPGLHADAMVIVAEVIESSRKPSRPWGRVAQSAFGVVEPVGDDRGPVWQTILALGHQDTDPTGLVPPSGIRIVGASSDHLITETDRQLRAGTEIGFRPGYGAFMRAMTSRSVTTVTTGGR